MASTNFLQFDEDKTNMLSDQSYNGDAQRRGGVSQGVARSTLYNKAAYQASTMVTAIAQLLVNNGKDAMDTTVNGLVTVLQQLLVDKPATDLATKVPASTGSATRPVYVNSNGIITQCNFDQGNNMTAPNYGAMYQISSGFTPPSNGWIYIRHLEWRSVSVVIEGKTVFNHVWGGGDFGTQWQCSYLPVKKGKQITFSGVDITVQFVPCS